MLEVCVWGVCWEYEGMVGYVGSVGGMLECVCGGYVGSMGCVGGYGEVC